MQKKIITRAVIAAAFSAPAFADSTVYGVLDAAVVSASADGQKSQLLTVSGGLSASRLGVKASEELDGGLKAIAVLEYGLADTQTKDGLTTATARQQLLGLAGSFGTVATGYLQTTGYDWGSKFDVTAGSSISPLQNITYAGSAGAGNGNTNFLIGSKAVASRAQRALAYISPDFGGFSFAVNYSTAMSGLGNLTVASSATDTNVTAALASANYDNGPLSVGLVYAGTSNPASTSNVTEYALGASYDFGIATLKGTFQSSKNGQTGTLGSADSAYSLGAVIPAGPGAVALSYAASNIASLSNSNASGYTVGYLQGLSKTTTAYVAYSGMSQGTATRAYSVDNSALSAATLTAGGNSSMIALGLNKKF